MTPLEIKNYLGDQRNCPGCGMNVFPLGVSERLEVWRWVDYYEIENLAVLRGDQWEINPESKACPGKDRCILKRMGVCE